MRRFMAGITAADAHGVQRGILALVREFP